MIFGPSGGLCLVSMIKGIMTCFGTMVLVLLVNGTNYFEHFHWWLSGVKQYACAAEVGRMVNGGTGIFRIKIFVNGLVYVGD